MRTYLPTLLMTLCLSLSALADEGKPAPSPAAEAPSAIQMEWNFTQPSPEISALSDECEKRFPGKSHTCEVISREKRSSHQPYLRPTRAVDVVLGSEFGRRGRIVCQLGVPQAALKQPKSFPWLTLAQMQDFFESETLKSQPWTCAMKKCEEGNCKTLGSAELLKN